MRATTAAAYAIAASLFSACSENSAPGGGADSGAADVTSRPDAEAPDAGPPPPPTVAPRPPAEAIFADINGDGAVDIADAIAFQSYVFRGGIAPACIAAADFNGDGKLEADDTYRISTHLVTGNQRVRPLEPRECAAAPPWPTGQAAPLAFKIEAPVRVTSTPFTARVAIVSPELAVQGWSLSITASECTVTAATTLGTRGAEVWDDPPGLRHLGYSGTFAVAGGAVTYVVLSQLEDVVMPPSTAAQPVLALELDGPIPASGCTTCAIELGGGLTWRGQTIEPVIAAGGYAYVPELPSASIEVCAP